MAVCLCAMGPERVLPNADDDFGEQEPGNHGNHNNHNHGNHGNAYEDATHDAGDDDITQEGEGLQGEQEVGENGLGGGGGEGEEEGEEEEDDEEGQNGGYYYQPLNQEPENSEEQIQERIQVMGLHLPAPPTDSDEEEDEEGEEEKRSRASIPMDQDHVDLVKRTMAGLSFPSLSVPVWARQISDSQWTDMVQNTLKKHTEESTSTSEKPHED